LKDKPCQIKKWE